MDMIKEFTELTQIPSPSLGERQMADRLIEKLEELGLSVYEDKAGEAAGGNAGNLYAVLSESDPSLSSSILLAAHMDRVPGGDRIVTRDHGEYLSSDGTSILAADDLAGVCAILDGIRRVKASGKPHGRVEIVFTICEEKETQGAKNLDYSRLTATAGYCLDSSGRFGRVITGAPRIDQFSIVVHGRSAHAGASPEAGLNALKTAAKIVANAEEGRLDFETTANIGVFRAGTVTNVICDRAELTGEARSRTSEKVDDYEKKLGALIEKEAAASGCTAEFTVRPNTAAFCVEEGSPVVTKLLAAIGAAGGTGYCEAGGGGMDANTFNLKGIPSVGVAIGYLKNHTPGEILYKEDLLKAGRMVEELIDSWAY